MAFHRTFDSSTRVRRSLNVRATVIRALVVTLAIISGVACGQQSSPQETVQATANLPLTKAYRVRPLGELLPSEPGNEGQHPLLPALRLADGRLKYIENFVSDYTCTLVKRERIDGELQPYEYLKVKCRNARQVDASAKTPFGVYMKYLAPEAVKNREILFVDGENDGDMLVRKGGRRRAYLEVWLDPYGTQAMRENRYPITEFGIENLVRRLIEVAQDDMQFGECHVRIVDNATLDNRSCTAIQVTHPERRDHFRFHVARILIDNELKLPVHYSAYDWPETEGGKPQLLEEYTYRNLQVNVGLSDIDFQRSNPAYGFRKTDG